MGFGEAAWWRGGGVMGFGEAAWWWGGGVAGWRANEVVRWGGEASGCGDEGVG